MAWPVQPPRKLHHFNVAKRFALQLARRADPAQVAVDIKLEHICRIVPRPSGIRGRRALKPESGQVKRVDVRVDEANRMIGRNVIVETSGARVC